MSDIVQRLREASQGREEWRVADPETGAYCMAFSHAGSPNPEREAREWLADHIARFPNSPNATKVVTHAIAHFLDDQMQIEAADLIEAQAERIRVLEHLVIDAAYTLDKARIWSGMGWTYNPLHPFHYTPMRERLHNECDSIEAARAALEATR